MSATLPSRRTLLAAMPIGLCGATVEACGRESTSRPGVCLSIGMDAAELLRRSTYRFRFADPAARASDVYAIDSPYDLTILVGDRRIILPNIGGDNLGTFIVIQDGHVSNFSLAPQTHLLSLDAAMAKTAMISNQLKDIGFSMTPNFNVEYMRRDRARPQPRTFREAQAALADPNLVIGKMSLFGAETPTLGAGLEIMHGARLLQIAAAGTIEATSSQI